MTRKVVIALFGAVLSLSFAQADTIIPGGYVSGIWTAAGSPFVIEGEITIHADSSLAIQPGVDVIFQSHDKFIINGMLLAVGTMNDSIHFTAAIPDTGWRGLRFMNTAETSQLAYCIIEYSRATPGTQFSDRHGGGIYCYYSISPVISHCSIRHNMAELYGGGIYYATNSSADSLCLTECDLSNNISTLSPGDGGGIYVKGDELLLKMQNCIISNNTANGNGGGICFYYGSQYYPKLQLTNCKVNNNHAGDEGGGIWMKEQSYELYLDIIDSDISYNTAVNEGGGICIESQFSGSLVNISGSTFIGNEVTGVEGKGGAIYGDPIPDSPYSILAYSTIADNHAFQGGGLYLTEWYFECDHLTLANNTATEGGGIYINVSGQLRMENSILTSNTSSAIHVGGSLNYLKYSDFYGNAANLTGNVPGWFGQLVITNANGDSCDSQYNIFLDPIFADTSSGDFHLLANSPCIDAGDPSAPLDPDSTITDMGFYFFDQRPPDIELSATLLDFSTVTVGESADLPLTIYNVGEGNLMLYDFACGLTAFSTSWNPEDSLVLPGDSLEITVTFAPGDTLSYTDTLSIENNCELCGVELLGQGAALGVSDPSSSLPAAFALHGPYPNPFNPTATFRIELPVASWVKLEIYDISGKSVATALEGRRAAGRHEASFEASELASGIYLYRLDAANFSTSGKMILLK